MKSDFLSAFFSLILLSCSCFGHGNFENFVCRRVDELFESDSSPQWTTKKVAQGPPGKTGPKGARGQIGAHGAVGPMGKNATVDYKRIERVIEEKVQTALTEIKEVIQGQSKRMEEIVESWNSSMTRMGEELKKLIPKNISHDIHGEVEITEDCEPAGCHSIIPQYSLSQSETVRIINGASECRQYIKLRCKGVMLLNGDNGWWVSRNGEKMRYWGGATSGRDGYCACGETGSCLDNSYKCNCDQNGDVITQDEGYITDKTKLPVRELRFGDMGGSGETAWYTLGPLECWG